MRREQVEAIGAGLLVFIAAAICLLSPVVLGFCLGRLTA